MENIRSSIPASRQILAAVFDLDGVLLNSEWLAFQVWQDWARLKGGTLSEAAFPGMIGISAEDTGLYVMEQSGVRFDLAESTAWTWEQISARLETETEPLPGAVDLVRRLAGCGCALAIASNAYTGYIDSAIAGLKLLEYFPIRVGIDQVKEGKPAPDVYLYAASRLGVAAGRCLAFEDSRVGVQAAAAAGMRVIAVPGALDHKNGFHKAWQVFPSLVEVEKQLHLLLN
ncbi:MAG: HAD family phosphatase [Chloroflexi bacterium]|nr:MAG: HAD family phosphatase [Chloroflexota bacterium]